MAEADGDTPDAGTPEALRRFVGAYFGGDAAAQDTVVDVVRHRPGEAVALLVELADAAPDDDALVGVGTGPLEDLLHLHGDAYGPELALAARRSANLRAALRMALTPETPPDVVREVDELLRWAER